MSHQVLVFPCNENCSVKASSASKTSKIWFKTTPFTAGMIPFIEQVQLCTYSAYDQGSTVPGTSWSWFEIAILPGNQPGEPEDDGLAWTSHHNRINPSNFSGYTGAIFDRQHQLVKSLQPGNVLAVRVCAQYPDWSNEAARGTLIVILTKDIGTIEPVEALHLLPDSPVNSKMDALTGTDKLVVGSIYIINTSGTSDVWTVEGKDIYLRPYDPNNKNQLFRATLDANNRYGFYSDAAARRVNRNQSENLKCEKTYATQGSWECFCEFRMEAPGKLKFFMTVWDEHRPLRQVSSRGGCYFTIQNIGSEVTFGLTNVSS